MTTQPQTKPEPRTSASIHELYTFYLSPAHLDADKPYTVTIGKAVITDVFDDKAGKELPRMVLHFTDARRSLKCNKTQIQAIWDITGTDDHTKCTGTRITMSKEPTKRGGKFTIKITKPKE